LLFSFGLAVFLPCTQAINGDRTSLPLQFRLWRVFLLSLAKTVTKPEQRSSTALAGRLLFFFLQAA